VSWAPCLRGVVQVQVSWGDPSMIDAERRLLASALLHPANTRFLLLSDSYVPACMWLPVRTQHAAPACHPSTAAHLLYALGVPRCHNFQAQKGAQLPHASCCQAQPVNPGRICSLLPVHAGSCLPMFSFQDVYDYVLSTNKSYVRR